MAGEFPATSRVRHGTPSGWRLHKELGQHPCDACYQAKSEYDHRRKAIPEETRKSRLSARAQAKASTELRHQHWEEYQEYFNHWKAVFQAEHDMEVDSSGG